MICCKLDKAMNTTLTQMTRYMTDVFVVVTVLFDKVYMVFSHKAYWSTREIAVENFWGGIIQKSVRFGRNLIIRRGTKIAKKSECLTHNDNYALPKLSGTQMLQYFIPLRTICHEVHNFRSNKKLAVFYIGETLHKK